MAFLMSPAFAEAQGITEKAVKELMQKMDRATAGKDANSVDRMLSENVAITVRISAGGNTQTTRMNKAEYMANLRNAWAAASNYSYRRNNESIAISGNTATVSADVTESMTVSGHTIRTQTRETATIELVDGMAKITKITGNVSM